MMVPLLRPTTCGLLLFAWCAAAVALETPPQRQAWLNAIQAPPGMRRAALGVTRQETSIHCLVPDVPLREQIVGQPCRVLLVGGLDGSADSVRAVLEACRNHAAHRDVLRLSAVPCGNPDGFIAASGHQNASQGRPIGAFPPPADAYASPTVPEAQYLWRWIGMQGFDLVIEVRAGENLAWHVPALPDPPQAWQNLTSRLEPRRSADQPGELCAALARHAPAELGTIPALRVTVPAGSNVLDDLSRAIAGSGFREFISPARRELIRRLERSAGTIALDLSAVYGHRLPSVQYIPAVALMGRLRLGALLNQPRHREDVQRIVAPYLTEDKPALPASPNGAHLAGHLVFAHLANDGDDPRQADYLALARRAADLGFLPDGSPQPAMPFHSEMSDAVFMGTPLLTAVGRLTGEKKYFEMAVRHVRFMRKLCVRGDGLYRHSPLDETAWGRGNGFPALGLAMALEDFPPDEPGREELLAAFREHLTALAEHQDPDGPWRQIIDHPASYRELTCTCMIAYAISRGVEHGWLDRSVFQPRLERAWESIRLRIGNDGRLMDVCEGTGKQTSRRAYFDRRAILGRDDRGGAMALWIATEMLRRQRSAP